MTKRRAFKRWIAGLSALVMLLTIGLALPVGARAEKNTVRVLLTRLNLTDRLEIALDGSYTLDGMSFQRGSRLVLSSAKTFTPSPASERGIESLPTTFGSSPASPTDGQDCMEYTEARVLLALPSAYGEASSQADAGCAASAMA